MITTEEKQRARTKDHEALALAKKKDQGKKLIPVTICKSPRTTVLVREDVDEIHLQTIINRHTKDGRIKINEIN